MLHRLILAVGLDRHQLVFELGQASLVEGDVLLELTPPIVVEFQLFFDGFDGLLCFIQSRIEARELLRMLRDRRFGLGNSRLQVLELNEAF